MTQTLSNNSFHILGLDTSSSQKDVSKRAKEIINRLKIDDKPVYETDIDVSNALRTESSVKEASERLQLPKKRIKEYFFWFQIADDIDERAIGHVRGNEYDQALAIWQKASDSDTAKALFYKKNLALLYCHILGKEDNKRYLQDSLQAWSDVINSDKFWSAFSKLYKLHDDQTSNQEIIDDFRGQAVAFLSDIFTELNHTYKDDNYINEFQKVFSSKGGKMEKTVLNPIYATINDAVESLEKMKISEDGVFDKDEADVVKKSVATIQSELNRLIDLGLYDDSQSKLMRDRAANALRTVVLDLHNNLNELNRSKKLLEAAMQICGTDSLRHKLKSELEQIDKNINEDIENSLSLEIPGYGGTIVFKNTFFVWGGKKVSYKDVTAIAYHSTRHSTTVYSVSVSTTYTYETEIVIGDDRVKFSLSAGSDESHEKETWAKLAGLLSHLIEPILIRKFVERIFDRGETVKIGYVDFTKDGYSYTRTKFFGGKVVESVPWDKDIYTPKFDSGEVILFKHDAKKDKGVQFASVSMSNDNAVIIPELVKTCLQTVLSNT
ncbi:hypothetical protein KBD61_01375 [Patescibacteria group bacterium]|nr:hypothetical protein [Patescibacteria group bacterium]MBP9709660.1 hypothetical protein [Patescibacteria group bacterium]